MTVNLFVFLWQISESGLIEILEKVNQQTEKKTTVKVGLTYWTYCVFSINTMSNLFIYCLHFSSTDGGLWTQMMMMMITNYQMEPWNPSDMDVFYWSATASLTSYNKKTSEFWHFWQFWQNTCVLVQWFEFPSTRSVAPTSNCAPDADIWS